jgi:phosphoribosylanthranilate isomerase
LPVVITQIYTAQTVAEALALAEVGVDHVGVTVADRGLPGEIDLGTGRAIVAALRGVATSVALTVDTDPVAVRMVGAALEPDILHLCGDTTLFPPAAVADLRAWLGRRRLSLALLQAIPIAGPEAVAEARRFARHVDWLLLVSVTNEIEGIGAAGVTHDWSISRRIVAESDVPVILAGGLGPDNVAEAIAAVGPAGVDSLTMTNRRLPGGGFEKDLAAVERFVGAARQAASG